MSVEKRSDTVIDEVKEYYGEILAGTKDLKTNACTTCTSPPSYVRTALKNIHPDVISKFYGCGFVCPPLLRGLRVLDLGCGAGRDIYILSQLVGEEGEVVGVDMTEEQLATGRRLSDWHRNKFGYAKSNVHFVQGYIERLEELDLAPASFDLIVSNCVINLSPDKASVVRGIYRLLKPGGELYFSDVYADKRIPKSLREDPVLWGECLSGALYWNDFLTLARTNGFNDPRLVEDAYITVNNPLLEKKLAGIQFFSATYRLWKLDDLETDCEDYGQAVRYKGTILDPEDAQNTLTTFVLDGHHVFATGQIVTVCGNTFRMIQETRYATHFDVFGDFQRHFGIFKGCGKALPFVATGGGSSSASSTNKKACCSSDKKGGACC